MKIMHILQTAAIGAVLLLGATAAQAQTAPKHHSVQNHHCKLSDGSTDAGKTHKQCQAAGGKWAKDGAAAAAPAPAAPAAPVAPAPAQQ